MEFMNIGSYVANSWLVSVKFSENFPLLSEKQNQLQKKKGDELWPKLLPRLLFDDSYHGVVMSTLELCELLSYWTDSPLKTLWDPNS